MDSYRLCGPIKGPYRSEEESQVAFCKLPLHYSNKHILNLHLRQFSNAVYPASLPCLSTANIDLPGGTVHKSLREHHMGIKVGFTQT